MKVCHCETVILGKQKSDKMIDSISSLFQELVLMYETCQKFSVLKLNGILAHFCNDYKAIDTAKIKKYSIPYILYYLSCWYRYQLHF